eukprot:m.37568 g.37568  ORF g.37568 m.37568 type:complete len:62 (-) comp12518_c0_seq1:619-804(-)
MANKSCWSRSAAPLPYVPQHLCHGCQTIAIGWVVGSHAIVATLKKALALDLPQALQEQAPS